jgi:hypothetical protein
LTHLNYLLSSLQLFIPGGIKIKRLGETKLKSMDSLDLIKIIQETPNSPAERWPEESGFTRNVLLLGATVLLRNRLELMKARYLATS